MKMTKMKTDFIGVMNDYLEDYTLNDLFDELFPAQGKAEIIYEMYENGMIPEDMMEKFLNDE